MRTEQRSDARRMKTTLGLRSTSLVERRLAGLCPCHGGLGVRRKVQWRPAGRQQRQPLTVEWA